MSSHLTRRLLWFIASAFFGIPFSASAARQQIDLGGAWQLQQVGKTDVIRATVPGNVHTDLLAAGKIPDPFYRDNESRLQWIGETSWHYQRSLMIPAAFLAHDKVLLRCEGLDTIAEVKVNGQPAGKADNMFRTWEFDVKPLLKPGSNSLEVTFFPIGPYIREFSDNAPKIPNASGLANSNVRKAPYSNGWDFGPKFLTCGIYKNIELLAFDEARIRDVILTQKLDNPGSAKLEISMDVETVGSPKLGLHAAVVRAGKEVARGDAPWAPGASALSLSIPNPELWWPAGMGGQPLYDVTISLIDRTGAEIDRTTRRIGLRKVDLLPPTADRPLRLAVNGKEFFGKGVNWIPGDMFTSRITTEKLRHYVKDAVASNMNMLRLWAGGYYEEDALFDACDEFGLLLWSDFKFACAGYPGSNPAFQENVRAEVTDQLRRIRHHPSIAVLCGNNECKGLITGYKLITQEQYDTLYHEVIGKTVAQVFPGSNYVGGSPEAGDEHNWWVWHVGADFEKYRDSHGWMTEFGFQSFPVPATVYSYTVPADRDSVLSAINKFHQRNGNKKGNEMILDKMNHYFRPAKDFDSTLWLSQINQAYGMEIGIEHWRADWPKSSGCFLWQYNDCWPGPTWSTVDYYGRWKAMQYRFRTVYAPVMVTGDVDEKKSTVQVRIASELKSAADAQLEWKLTDLAGKTLASGRSSIHLPADTASTAGPLLTLAEPVKKAGAENALLWLNVTAAGQKSSKLLAFVHPKDLKLVDPKLGGNITAAGDGFDITVRSAHPSLWTWLNCADADARYSDNFFHLAPGETAKIHLTPSRRMTIDELKKSLKVQSLYDTYDPRAVASSK